MQNLNLSFTLQGLEWFRLIKKVSYSSVFRRLGFCQYCPCHSLLTDYLISNKASIWHSQNWNSNWFSRPTIRGLLELDQVFSWKKIYTNKPYFILDAYGVPHTSKYSWKYCEHYLPPRTWLFAVSRLSYIFLYSHEIELCLIMLTCGILQ